MLKGISIMKQYFAKSYYCAEKQYFATNY